MYLDSSRRGLLCWLTTLMAAALAGDCAAQEQKTKSQEQAQAASDDTVYETGGDVKAPKLVHYVEPEFSGSSKEAFVEGTVKISTVVNIEGKTSTFKVVHGLNSEEDHTAVEALKKWTFSPGTKAGRPVCVRVTVEIDFHLL